MKSFLLKGKKPIVKWGMIPKEIYFEGTVPENYSLAVSPSDNYIVLDVDRHGDIDGFDNIPYYIKIQLQTTLNYKTKNNGAHYWFKYTGDKKLANKASGLGIDLRTNKGYVVWYPKEDIRDKLKEINNTSLVLNEWLVSLFTYVKKK
jgi:hypothetical protein